MREFDYTFDDCLFRYRRITDKNMEALNSNRLYFSTPIKDFNDPYDNLLFADSNKIVSDIISNIEYGMDDYLEEGKERDPVDTFIFLQQWNDSNQRSQIINEHIDRICSTIDNIKKAVRYNSKIICFSEVYNSMLMWAHYADYHRGYTLIYEKEDLAKAPRFNTEGLAIKNHTRLEKVKYVSQQIDLTDDIEEYIRYNVFGNMGDVETKNGDISKTKLRQSITEKSEEWEYEKEWRLIPRIINLDDPSPLGYIECAPSGIIIGAHCSNENRERIITICRKNHIHIYQMFLDESNPTFKLNIGEGENAHIC